MTLIYLAVRVADVQGPERSSSKRVCGQCGEEVWVELRHALDDDCPAVLCVQCVSFRGSGASGPGSEGGGAAAAGSDGRALVERQDEAEEITRAARPAVGTRGRRAGMGSHSRPGRGETDEWYTPPGIFAALGLEFDLDPCAPVGGLPWVPARRFHSIEDDGLAQPWSGRVWLNPPYGRLTSAWMRRLAAHGNGIALVFARTETAWWTETVGCSDAVCFVAGRLTFVGAGGQFGPHNAGASSALVGYGRDNAEAIARAQLGMTFEVRAAPLGGQGSLWESAA